MSGEQVYEGQPIDDNQKQSNLPINPFESSTGMGALMAQGVDPAIIASAETAKMQIQMSYFMAKQAPRNKADAWSRIIAECQRPKFAKEALYSKPVGGTSIVGPSVRLAEGILRNWGNVLTRTQVVYENEDTRRALVQVIDLETNVSYTKEIVTHKTVERSSAGKDREILGERLNSRGQVVYIVRATEEEVQNKENSAISKTLRNEGLRIIPVDVLNDAIDTVKKTRSQQNAADPDRSRKVLIVKFDQFGVKVRNIEEWLGHGFDQASPSEIDELMAVEQAIRDGETTWTEVMEAKREHNPDVTSARGTKATAGRLEREIAEGKEASPAGGDDSTDGASIGSDQPPNSPPAPNTSGGGVMNAGESHVGDLQDTSPSDTQSDKWDAMNFSELSIEVGKLAKSRLKEKKTWESLSLSRDEEGLRSMGRRLEGGE